MAHFIVDLVVYCGDEHKKVVISSDDVVIDKWVDYSSDGELCYVDLSFTCPKCGKKQHLSI